MIIYRSEKFEALYKKLQPDIKRKVESAFSKWSEDPQKYPKLEWKVVNHAERWWSIRIADTGFRAVCLEDIEEEGSDPDYIWFFVGSHDDYLRLLP